MKRSIKTLIIEDEQAAVNRLKKELDRLPEVQFEVIQVLDSVSDAVSLLESVRDFELIFLDIHLVDGLSLEIFNQVKVTSPVIFK